jgi:hypothetical protein
MGLLGGWRDLLDGGRVSELHLHVKVGRNIRI